MTLRMYEGEHEFLSWEQALENATRAYWANWRNTLRATTPKIRVHVGDGRTAREHQHDTLTQQRREQREGRPATCIRCGAGFRREWQPRSHDYSRRQTCGQTCEKARAAERLRQRRRTACGQCQQPMTDGHPNCDIRKDGKRDCRNCRNARKRRTRAERKAAA